MQRFDWIRSMPGCVGPGGNAHESVLRAYQILEVVKDWGRRGAPASVLLEIVEHLESRPPSRDLLEALDAIFEAHGNGPGMQIDPRGLHDAIEKAKGVAAKVRSES